MTNLGRNMSIPQILREGNSDHALCRWTHEIILGRLIRAAHFGSKGYSGANDESSFIFLQLSQPFVPSAAIDSVCFFSPAASSSSLVVSEMVSCLKVFERFRR